MGKNHIGGALLFGLVTMAALTLLYGIDLNRDLIQVNNSITGKTKMPICSVETEKPEIALTFDAAWAGGKLRNKGTE